jgi:hypothetical protein
MGSIALNLTRRSKCKVSDPVAFPVKFPGFSRFGVKNSVGSRKS